MKKSNWDNLFLQVKIQECINLVQDDLIAKKNKPPSITDFFQQKLMYIFMMYINIKLNAINRINLCVFVIFTLNSGKPCQQWKNNFLPCDSVVDSFDCISLKSIVNSNITTHMVHTQTHIKSIVQVYICRICFVLLECEIVFTCMFVCFHQMRHVKPKTIFQFEWNEKQSSGIL